MELYPEGTELVWRRSFPGLAEQARQAREFVALLLDDLPNLDDAILVTGELVANALRHTASAQAGGKFLLEVRRRPHGATVAITDQGSSKVPTIPRINDLAESGRGLYTAQILATNLSWRGDETGRTLMATFRG